MVRLLLSLIALLAFCQPVNADTVTYSCTQNRASVSNGTPQIWKNEPTMTISIKNETVITRYLKQSHVFTDAWKVQSNDNKSIIAIRIDDFADGISIFHFSHTNKTYSTASLDSRFAEVSRGQCY
jgi:ABC-type uncharacterized transport system auxiliary subunit